MVTSLTYPQFGFILQERGVNLSLIGRIPIVIDRKTEGEIKTMTIKKERSDRWHMTFVSEIKDTEIKSNSMPMEITPDGIVVKARQDSL